MNIELEINHENSTFVLTLTREDDSSIIFELYLDEKTELSINAIMQLRDFLEEYVEENADSYDNDDEIECDEGVIQ